MPEFTVKRARQHTLQRLGKIEKSLSLCSGYWGDLDETITSRIDDVFDVIEELKDDMDAAVELHYDDLKI